MQLRAWVSRFAAHETQPALALDERTLSYRELLEGTLCGVERAPSSALKPGTVVFVVAEHTPEMLAALLSHWAAEHIVVPCAAERTDISDLIAISQPEVIVDLRGGKATLTHTGQRSTSPLLEELRARHAPGLVLFTSGTSGKPKAVVHDVQRLLERFGDGPRGFVRLLFLGLDHIAGLETAFFTLASGGLGVFPRSRAPADVCRAIARHGVQVLPVSPTFLNLLLLDGSRHDHDLSSLQYITYGSEIMLQSTLMRCSEAFPGVKLKQNYGTTEVGALSGKSRSSDARWLKLSATDCDMRVVDGVLHVRSNAAMLGYLNAPSPFTADGWYVTQDLVEQDGDYIRVVGRASDVINVGGSKVFPAEVESVLEQFQGVIESLVYPVDHPLLGQIVCATVRTAENADRSAELALKLRLHCRQHLDSYKVPMRVDFSLEPLGNQRFKKPRWRTSIAT